MSRRPLGASLPLDARAAALEAAVRAFHALVDDELVAALYALDTGRDMETDEKVRPDQAARRLRGACRRLQELRERPIRAARHGDAGVGVAGRRG